MTRWQICQITLVLFITLCCVMPSSATTILPPSQQQLKQSINSLYKARTTIITNHLAQGGEGQPSTSLAEKDFNLFISYLDGRIVYYCEQLFSSGGVESLTGTPCTIIQEGTPGTGDFPALPEDTVETAEEKAAALDRQLQASFGAFDDMLLKEQEQVAANESKQRESTGYPRYPETDTDKPGAHSTDKTGTESGQATASASAASSRKKPATTGTSNRVGGAGSTRQTRLPPTSGTRDLSQNDDDVVAKQLREAAEQETDPEVKAKLWEEYRNYKEGVN